MARDGWDDELEEIAEGSDDFDDAFKFDVDISTALARCTREGASGSDEASTPYLLLALDIEEDC